MNNIQASPTIDRIISWSLEHPFTPLTRYLTAALLVTGAAVIRATVITSLLPWLLFIPIILLIALTMGRRTGLFAVGLSTLAAGLTISHPGAAFWLTGPQWVASLLFILVNAAIVAIAAELRAAMLRGKCLSEERERMHALLVDKEGQTQLLAQELGHRLKNLLTIIQAVASQTLRQSPDLPTASDALAFRLAAFGRAADVLTASTWESADLHTLAHTALGNHDRLADRFRIDGPPVRFNSQVALSLALAFHELATNATKYGALSNDTGYVDLRWSIEPGVADGEQHFRLLWKEIGGPPVQPPGRRGFGSVMIERSLRAYFRSGTAISYEPKGLEFRIDASFAGEQVDGQPLLLDPDRLIAAARS